jgi:hypothetical protein
MTISLQEASPLAIKDPLFSDLGSDYINATDDISPVLIADASVPTTTVLVDILDAVSNPEGIYVISADQVSSTEIDFNDASGNSASENFEFGIADIAESNTSILPFDSLDGLPLPTYTPSSVNASVANIPVSTSNNVVEATINNEKAPFVRPLDEFIIPPLMKLLDPPIHSGPTHTNCAEIWHFPNYTYSFVPVTAIPVSVPTNAWLL